MKKIVSTLILSSLCTLFSIDALSNYVYVKSLGITVHRGYDITYGQAAHMGIFGRYLGNVSSKVSGLILVTVDLVVYDCQWAISKCDQSKIRHEWRK